MVIELFVKTSFPELFSKYNVEVEIREVNVYGGGAVVFDDVLDHNQILFVPIFTRGRNKWHYVFFYLNQIFDILPNQTSKVIENIWRDIAGIAKKSEKFAGFCREAGKDRA